MSPAYGSPSAQAVEDRVLEAQVEREADHEGENGDRENEKPNGGDAPGACLLLEVFLINNIVHAPMLALMSMTLQLGANSRKHQLQTDPIPTHQGYARDHALADALVDSIR